MERSTAALGAGCDLIPSIQPVNNRYLTLLAAGKKPLIDPFHRTMREHHGVDYLVPEGTPVFATADGRVETLSEKNSTHGKAITGNTGLSLAPHLHYEVIFNDTRVDPIHYFFMELTPEEYARMIRIALSSMQSFD